MRALRLLAASTALFTAALPAHADQVLPPGRIIGSDPANGDVVFGGLKFGKRQGGKTVWQPDSVQIQGSGSTGEAGGLSNTVLGTGAVPRPINDKDTVSVLDFGAVCDGASHPMSSYYGTLAAAQADYPQTVALTDERDTVATRSALATGKSAYTPKGGSRICVIGDVVLSGSTQQLFGQGSVVRPAPGASFLTRVSGYANGVSGLFVQDNGNLAAKATLAASAAAGATTVTIGAVSSGPAVQVGQRYSIRLDNGSWATGFVTGVSGSTVTLRDPLPAAAASGRAFWSTFGLIHVTNAKRFNIRDIEGDNIWGGILIDDPSNQAAKGHVDRVNFAGGVRMFGVVKGRDASDNTITRTQLWGGWYVSGAWTGDGSTTTFALPEQVFLTREMAITVAGAAKAAGTDYTIASNGLSVTFTSAPANGAAIAYGFQTYGHDGIVDDGRDVVTSTGGNYYGQVSALQFRRCGNLKGAQLYSFKQSIFDGCSEYSVIADGVSQEGELDALIGWGTVGLKVTGNSTGLKANAILSPMPASSPVSGVAEVNVSVDPGSDLTGRIHNKAAGWTDYNNGLSAFTIDASGNRTWAGTAGTMTLSAAGDVIGLNKSGFNYFACGAANATCVFQAGGANSVAQLQATGTVKLSVGSADAVAANASQVNVGSATQHVKLAGATPAVSACGTAPALNGTDHAGRITEGSSATGCTLTFGQAFASAPFCTVTSEAGLGFSYAVSATALTITNVGSLSGTKLDYICLLP